MIGDRIDRRRDQIVNPVAKPDAQYGPDDRRSSGAWAPYAVHLQLSARQ